MLFCFTTINLCKAQSRDLIMKIWQIKKELTISTELSAKLSVFNDKKCKLLKEIDNLETTYYNQLESGNDDNSLKSEIIHLYHKKSELIRSVKAEAIKLKNEAFFLELIEHIRPKDLQDFLELEILKVPHKEIFEQWLQSIKYTALGKKIEDFSLSDENGNEISTKNLRGKIVWIDSWASKCGPCIRKLKQIQQVYKKYNKNGFEILAVSWDYNKQGYMKTLQAAKQDWLKVMQKHQFNWLNVFDEDDRIMGSLLGSVGKNLLVDENGIIIGFDLHPLEIEGILENRSSGN